MLKTFFYSEDKLRTEISKEELVDIIKQKKGLLWLDINDPTEQEIDILVDEFDFHPLAIGDCIFPQNHPKINDFGSNIFMVFHAITCPNGNICTSELDLFLGENYLITFYPNN